MDYLRLRHGKLARWVRGGISRWLAGPNAWPLVFRAPSAQTDFPHGVSSNLYVHLPFCKQLCPHCPYNRILMRSDLVNAYGRALEREVAGYLRRPGVPTIRTLYFGGGTPSQTPKLIEQVVTMVRSKLAFAAEIGVEVHPADASSALLARLREAGVNRISLGVESLRDDLLRKLARRYDPQSALEAIRAARSVAFSCVDVNLIIGMPGQRAEDSATDAERCLALGADQVSAYPLFHFAHSSFGRNGRVQDSGERERLRALKAVSRVCRAAGLQRTSVWSFTRTGLSPYSTVTHEDYVGFGAGAGSKVGGVFWFNTFSVPEYAGSMVVHPALVMQAGERLRRVHWLYWAIYGTHIEASRYQALFGRSLKRDFGLLLTGLRAAGLARSDAAGWTITETGAIWVHRVQSLFSLSYIDNLWQHCRDHPWPREVVLV